MSQKKSLLNEEYTQDRDDTVVALDQEMSPLRKDILDEQKTFFHDIHPDVVKTKAGDIHVFIQGKDKPKSTALITLHDIGQNHASAFQSFFCFHQFKPVLDKFTVYHLNFPGQHENADELAPNYVFPTMEEMAGAVVELLQHYKVTNTVCFGIGAGANVLTRVALLDPKHIECLINVNGDATTASWSEWTYEKLSSHYLKNKGMTQFCLDYLLYHYLGHIGEHSNHDLVDMVTAQLHRIPHPRNLALFIDAYSKRSAIKITRPVMGQPPKNTLKCGTLLITGDMSPAVDATVTFNSKLDPTNSTWIKVSDSTSLVLEEHPTRVANAVVLFLQGFGHVLGVRPPALSFSSLNEEVQGPPAIV